MTLRRDAGSADVPSAQRAQHASSFSSQRDEIFIVQSTTKDIGSFESDKRRSRRSRLFKGLTVL
jgi:hypothetical protein